MHELSLGTWFIHIATLFEWSLAIIIITMISNKDKENSMNWLALSMIPNLASAMTAITWHLFDNSLQLKGLVVLQAALTVIGNTSMAIAAFNLLRVKQQKQC